MSKRYNEQGFRVTDCCGAMSSYGMDDGVLSCKKCRHEVEVGEGDGIEKEPKNHDWLNECFPS
jgi:hypothetical protein